MPKLNRDGVNIYYEVHGSGPVLLLTHGYSATAQMWKGQIEALSKLKKKRFSLKRPEAGIALSATLSLGRFGEGPLVGSLRTRTWLSW